MVTVTIWNYQNCKQFVVLILINIMKVCFHNVLISILTSPRAKYSILTSLVAYT